MTKKEKMRFSIAVVLSVIAVISSVTAISCGISVIFADPTGGNEVLPGGGLFAFAVMYLTEMLIAVFAASASILGAFFAFSVRKQEKKAIKNISFALFGVNTVLAVLDIAVAVIMSF